MQRAWCNDTEGTDMTLGMVETLQHNVVSTRHLHTQFAPRRSAHLVVTPPNLQTMNDIYGQDRVIECRVNTTFSTRADGQVHMRSLVLRY